MKIPALGAGHYQVKSRQCAIVICPSPETTREVDIPFLQTVLRFDFVGDFQREDGIFERIQIDGIAPEELDLAGDWEFNVVGHESTIKKLANF